ncbi:MAG: DNA-binding response OmpR family regulator [Phenylobacterium sp.]|jgi:DNA-binding response OmpR family regulator
MKKVLVIDDDVAFNNILKEQLEWAEYEVACAFDGREGLKVYDTFAPDIVITDIIMPDKDGIEVILELITKKEKPGKIIVMSGGGRIAGIEYLNLTKNLGVESILEKPFSFSDLQKELEAD